MIYTTSRADAEKAINNFLKRELNLEVAPGFTMEDSGAFWILENDTTSYVHDPNPPFTDGITIEWYGTSFNEKED